MKRRLREILIAGAGLLALTAPAIAQSIRPETIADAVTAVARQEPAPDPMVEWQRKYDAARHEKDHGKVLRILGLPTTIVGITLVSRGSICSYSSVTHVYSSCGSSGVRGLGYAVFLGGIGMGVWGEMQFKDGDHEMTRLAMMKPQSKSGFDLALGPTTSIGYHIAW